LGVWYLLQGLEDAVHVGDLAVVGVEGEVDVDAADAVDRHCGGRRGRWRSGRAGGSRRGNEGGGASENTKKGFLAL
jgi:hypothetical protein